MELYDLVLLIMSFFPGIGPAIVGFCVVFTTLLAAVNAGLGIARTIVKLTFWTRKDDELLRRFEAWHERITNGPFAPLFEVIDRLSLLKNIRKGK